MEKILAATSNMLARIRELEITANNLSNVNTPGYKRDRYFADILEEIQTVEGGAYIFESGMMLGEQSRVDLSQGPLDQTGNPLDLGINGQGFFVVEDDAQDEVYTRNGDFHLDREGYLIANSGKRVLGQGGRIQLPPGEIRISKGGRITVDGKLIDELRLVLPDQNEPILKRGNSEYLFTITPDGEKGDIVQGSLERSNVEPVESMVRMVELQRDFESNQRMLKSFDEINRIAANEIGKI